MCYHARVSTRENMGLEELRAHAVKTFRRGGGSRPDVLLIRTDGEQAVLKDYGRAHPPCRGWRFAPRPAGQIPGRARRGPRRGCFPRLISAAPAAGTSRPGGCMK